MMQCESCHSLLEAGEIDCNRCNGDLCHDCCDQVQAEYHNDYDWEWEECGYA